jgi:hypothetical protein
MTTSNNSGSGSGNCSTGGTIWITGTKGGGGGGGYVTVLPTQTITVTTTGANPFIGIDWAVPVEEKKKKSDGCTCKKCKEFFEYAEPNQEDGTLICWACRHGY